MLAVNVSAETAKEKQKRRNRLRHDYERELYERLYDDRVLVNRTRFAACDRSRPLYILQVTDKPRGAGIMSITIKPRRHELSPHAKISYLQYLMSMAIIYRLFSYHDRKVV